MGRVARTANWLVGLALLGCGCAATRSLPPVDLQQAGWTVWHGQAVWKTGADRPPLAGELVVARHESGDVWVHFAKPPFPIFTARTAGRAWRIDFVENGRSYEGGGSPPRRFVWFRLPELLREGVAPKEWETESEDGGRWSLVNPETGESIRLVLDP